MSILVADMHKHKRIVTSAPNLKCRHIVHIDVVFYMKSNDWKKAYTAVLQETEKRGFSSLAVPALGTGKRGRFLLSLLSSTNLGGNIVPCPLLEEVLILPLWTICKT